ncbi:MAG: cation transporter [Acidobacteria bacterium]|nr:cation transporter [Acidobacteriota bacterium]
MTHNHAHHSVGQGGKKRLIQAISITGAWFIIEVAGGIYSNSLALIADAAHMLTDLGALSLSLFALWMSARPATHQKTYGYLRAEILAALANGIFLVLIGSYIFYEAFQRFRVPPEIKSIPMLLVASTGLAANLVTARLLFRSRNESLNLRGAYLHVLMDALGSVGAILAGFLIWWRHWYGADAVVSVIVGTLVLYGSWKLVSESVDILLEATPRHLEISSILKDLGSVRGVASVHDLHVWSISTRMAAMSCHVVLKGNEDPGAVLSELSRLMRNKYGIGHTTIQIEPQDWIPPAGVTLVKFPES